MPKGNYKRNGITKETADHFLVDAGAVYLNLDEPDERLLGATSGGNTFTLEQEFRQPEIDGSPGPLKGTRRIISVNAILEINLIELTKENLMMALAGADSTASPDDSAATHDVIRRTRNITAADYIKNVALIGTVSGSDEPAIFMIYNGLHDDNLELGSQDQNEGILTLTIKGHFEPEAMDQEPWEIRWPRNNNLQSGTPTTLA